MIFELGNFEKLVAQGNHTGMREPRKQIVLVEVEPGTQRSQFLTVGVEVGPLQSWESRSGGGEKKRRTPKIREKCIWEHTRKKRWVEYPFRKKGVVFLTPVRTWGLNSSCIQSCSCILTGAC